MPHWKELPSSLDERIRQLIVQLRRLKDHSGLSLASLESKTGYSRTSWERYLNGKTLPPQQAVEALARVTGTEPTRLLVLHEVAAKAWQERTAHAASADGRASGTREAEGPEAAGHPGPEGAPAGPTGRRGRFGAVARATRSARSPGVRAPVVVAAVVAAALVGTGAGTLIDSPAAHDDTAGGSAPTTTGGTPASTATATEGPGPYVYKLGRTYPCEVHRTRAAGGGLSARYSTTRTAVLAGPGWDVVEAQCLLQYHRMDPGVVDGIYGQQARAAAARLQKEAGLPADGIVGPDTWRVLRK